MAFYSEHFPDGSAVSDIILCGGNANMRELKTTLAAQIPNAAVHYGNPFLNIGRSYKKKGRAKKNEKIALDFLNPALPLKADSMPLTAEEASAFVTAIGLALMNI